MNDRYLFKAKRIDWQDWVKECQWFQGNLITIGERYYLAQCKNNANELWIGEWIEIDPTTLCQCTGLKDKNGNLIWENDIVKCGKTMLVSWNEKFSSWCLTRNWLYDYFFGESCEAEECAVYGNIFDNPELLEVK